MGVISITGLRLMARHGVMEQERRVGNEFEVDISLTVPMADRAMLTDSLEDTVNYARVVEIVKEEMSMPSRLIEAVAGRIRRRIADEFGPAVQRGSITISKIAPPISAQLQKVSFTTTWN